MPSLLYGFDNDGYEERVLLTVDEKELVTEYRKRGPAFKNTLYSLSVDGVEVNMLVVPRELTIHPSTHCVPRL